MEKKKEFMKSKQAGWDRVKIRTKKYLFCCKIAGLLENSYHKWALADHKKTIIDGAANILLHKTIG